MPTLPRPPTDLSPAQFFESWLPDRFAAMIAEAMALRPDGGLPDITATVTLDGDGGGGGAWTLLCRGGALTVTRGAAPTADVALVQTVADWRAAVYGEAGAPDVVPPGGNPIAILASTNQALIKALRELRGTLRLEMPGFVGRTWALGVAFQGAAAPEAVISVDAATVVEIQRGTIPAPQAFFTGKIAMRGDTAFAMQVGMTLMAQLGA